MKAAPRLISTSNGDIAGVCTDPNGDSQAVRWLAGDTEAESIETVLTTSQSTVAAISSQGLIAGTYRTNDGFAHAFLWDPDSNSFEDVPPLSGGHSIRAIDLN